jgi:hypothetical protein
VLLEPSAGTWCDLRNPDAELTDAAAAVRA